MSVRRSFYVHFRLLCTVMSCWASGRSEVHGPAPLSLVLYPHAMPTSPSFFCLHLQGRGPLTGVVTAGQGSLASKAARKTGFPGGSLFAAAARKSGNPGGGYLARKSGWPGGGAFPVPDSEGEEEDEEEEDSQEDSQEEGGDSGEEEEQEEEGQEGGGRQHEGAGAQVADDRPAADALMDALEAAEAPGDFATGGKMRLVLPGLELLSSSRSDGGSSSGDGDNGGDGSGGGAGISRGGGGGGGGGGKAEVIGLPLSEAAAAALKAACELAPFGRRDKTLRDTKVGAASLLPVLGIGRRQRALPVVGTAGEQMLAVAAQQVRFGCGCDQACWPAHGCTC